MEDGDEAQSTDDKITIDFTASSEHDWLHQGRRGYQPEEQGIPSLSFASRVSPEETEQRLIERYREFLRRHFEEYVEREGLQHWSSDGISDLSDRIFKLFSDEKYALRARALKNLEDTEHGVQRYDSLADEVARLIIVEIGIARIRELLTLEPQRDVLLTATEDTVFPTEISEIADHLKLPARLVAFKLVTANGEPQHVEQAIRDETIAAFDMITGCEDAAHSRIIGTVLRLRILGVLKAVVSDDQIESHEIVLAALAAARGESVTDIRFRIEQIIRKNIADSSPIRNHLISHLSSEWGLNRHQPEIVARAIIDSSIISKFVGDYGKTESDVDHVGDGESVRQYHEETLELAIDHGNVTAQANTLTILGAIAEYEDDIDLAINYYQRAISLQPELTEPKIRYANILQEDRPEEAKEHYQQALSIESGFAEAHLAYAQLLEEKLDEPGEAIRHYRRVIDSDLDSVEAHLNVARLLRRKLNQLEKAADHYETAVEIAPEDPDVCFHYAKFLHESGDLNKAIDYYQRALEAQPEFAEAHIHKAASLVKLGNQRAAKFHYRKAIELKYEYFEDTISNTNFEDDFHVRIYRELATLSPELLATHVEELAEVLEQRPALREDVFEIIYLMSVQDASSVPSTLVEIALNVGLERYIEQKIVSE